MKKSDRAPRPRIPRPPKPDTAGATGDGARGGGKIDAWRDAPKEEISARGKKGKGAPTAPSRDKKKETRGGERTERPQRNDTGGKSPFGSGRRAEGEQRDDRKPFQKSGFKKSDGRPPRREDDGSRPAKPRAGAKSFGEKADGGRGEKKQFARRDDRREDGRPPRGERPFTGKPTREGGSDEKRAPRAEGSFSRKPRREDDRQRTQAPRGGKPFPPKRRRDDDRDAQAQRDVRPPRANSTKKISKEEDDDDEDETAPAAASGPMTLNKYLAHAGLSSRRDAAVAIKDGKVKVNGEVLLTPGYRVQPDDKVTFEGKSMKPHVKKVYVLLNKPKGFITTTEDEHDRRTVMELVQSVEAERLYPVGRLDRNTTGVLLLTNDGDLAQRLTHPKYEAKKIYQVGLNKPLTKADFEKLLTTGVELEDGIAKPDKLSFLETPDELGLEIHSGRNRIVRRMFEALGYEVEKLDRVMFAGLTKKNVSRGQWRHLTEQEIIRLKHFKADR